MSVIDKVKWVLGILLVFVIVLITNLVDKDNFNKIRYSIETIYEDRVVAEDLIVGILTLVHEKEIAILKEDKEFFNGRNKSINNSIDNSIERYEQTKITKSERAVFDDFQEDLASLRTLEKKIDFKNSEKLVETLESMKKELLDLSKIQLSEGQRQKELSERTFESIELFTSLEIIFLILSAIMIQIIIIYKPKKM